MQNNMQNPVPAGRQEKMGEPLNKNLALVCGAIIFAAIIISGAVFYSKSNSSDLANNIGNNAPIQQPQQQPAGSVKVSVDDDPILGDKNAPLTMIEFSDYECPFCKRHFDKVYSEIKKNYIDTGKLKLVYRDFIAVSGHNPLATSEAMAAQCAKDQGGDTAYFKYHDEIFKRTTSNGNGLAVSQLPAIAKELGLNVNTFQQCLDSNKYKAEVQKDIADASKAGVSGTPSFFIGKSSPDGLIEGTIIIGAQPYSAFKVIIDQLLNSK